MSLQVHPYASLFPLVGGGEFDALKEDIREHGIREPIVLLDEQILDGRNRWRALQELVETGEVLGAGWGHRAGEALAVDALQPPQLWFSSYKHPIDGDALDWVVSKNLRRRHLDESQRGLIAGRIANMRQGERTDVKPSANLQKVSTGDAAKILSVSERTAAAGRKVSQQGSPALQQAVEQRQIKLSVAETLAQLPQEEQARLLQEAAPGAVRAAAKEMNAIRRRTRFEHVNQKLAAISEGSKPLPSGQRYPIIYADPATRYVSGFGDRSIENHYPTMTVEELCALPVSDLAMDAAVLFIWSTVPQLRNTMRIIEAWGFNYVSEWMWDKEIHGTGHWGFNQHEPLLIATRGGFPAPVPGTQPRSLYREAKTDHSVKPTWFAEQIERIWPKLPKIELFARNPRSGWAAWGNQADASRSQEIESSDGDPENFAHSGVLTEDGAGPLPDVGPLAAGVAPGPSDSFDELPREEASGTAREAPSTGSGDAVLQAASGIQSAPPQISNDDGLDIPEFLRRRAS